MFVVKQVSLRFFPRGNLRLLLTSPMGTTSTLLFERPRDVLSSNFDDWPFLSVHFWGEKADGRWTLQIINAGNRHVNSPGKLNLKFLSCLYFNNSHFVKIFFCEISIKVFNINIILKLQKKTLKFLPKYSLFSLL